MKLRIAIPIVIGLALGLSLVINVIPISKNVFAQGVANHVIIPSHDSRTSIDSNGGEIFGLPDTQIFVNGPGIFTIDHECQSHALAHHCYGERSACQI